jgi:orotate phosphoribosyltransferase
MKKVLNIFKKSGALLSGHFCLTSGLHSPTYFQCAQVLQYPRYCRILAKEIVHHFREQPIDVVVAPAIGGIVVGQEVGRQLSARTIFAERKNGVMSLRRGFRVMEGERVLICEDVVTTGGSVFEVLELIKSAGADVIGVGFIVDRSNGEVNFKTKQHAVLQLKTETYTGDQCPLCRQGLPIDKPGSR